LSIVLWYIRGPIEIVEYIVGKEVTSKGRSDLISECALASVIIQCRLIVARGALSR